MFFTNLESSAETMAPDTTVFRFVRGDALVRMIKIKQFQQLTEDDALVDESDLEFKLFISHRWTSNHHPDDDGAQLRAVQTLLRAVIDVAVAMFVARTDEERSEIVPDLRVHGILQAAILVSRFLCKHAVRVTTDLRKWLLERIGVWYDFMCLPQKPRTREEEQYFRQCLQALPRLLREVPIISLRQYGDDYHHRGWCLAEIAVGGMSNFHPLVLRVDLLGKPIERPVLEDFLEATTKSKLNSQFAPSARRALSVLRSWPSMSQTEIGDETSICLRPCPSPFTDECKQGALCCEHDNFGVWLVQGLAAAEAELQSRVVAVVSSLVDAAFEMTNDFHQYLRQASQRRQVESVDLVGFLRNALGTRNILCTNGGDIATVGFMMVYSGCAGLGKWEDFLRQCLQRYLEQQPLQLRQFVFLKTEARIRYEFAL